VRANDDDVDIGVLCVAHDFVRGTVVHSDGHHGSQMLAVFCADESVECGPRFGFQAGLHASEIHADSFGARMNQRVFDHVQHVQFRAERARQLASIRERGLRYLAEIRSNQDIGDFDHCVSSDRLSSTPHASRPVIHHHLSVAVRTADLANI
jgi:hypothetical protein